MYNAKSIAVPTTYEFSGLTMEVDTTSGDIYVGSSTTFKAFKQMGTLTTINEGVVVKFTKELDLQWVKSISINTGSTWVNNLKLTPAGNLLVATSSLTPWTGNTYKNAGLLQINPTDGSTTWIS